MPASRLPGGFVAVDAAAAPPAPNGSGSTAPRTVFDARLEAPCETCQHVAVCAIRSRFEAADALSMSIPAIGGGARVADLVIRIECDHYLRRPKLLGPRKPKEGRPA